MRQGWGCPLPAGHCGEAGRLRHAAGSAHCGRAGEALTSPRSLAHRSRELQHAETTLAVVAAGLAVGLGTGMVGRGHRTPVSPFPRPPPWHAALGGQKPSPCPFSDVSYPCALSRGGGSALPAGLCLSWSPQPSFPGYLAGRGEIPGAGGGFAHVYLHAGGVLQPACLPVPSSANSRAQILCTPSISSQPCR